MTSEADRAVALLQGVAADLATARDLQKVLDIRDKAEAIRQYQRQIGASREAYNNVAEIKLRAERRAGELLAEMPKDKGGRPGKNQSRAATTLEDVGVTKSDSSRWQLEAKVPEEKFQKYVETCREEGADVTQAGLLKVAKGGSLAQAANSGEIEWYTPKEYIECAREVMGRIDVDPASSVAANEIVEAATYYTLGDSGLEHEWRGAIWMNPPYAASQVSAFAAKLVEERQAGRVQQAVVLVNNATDTKWFLSLVELSSAVCFKTGRIAYIGSDGEAKSGAAQGQAFIYIGRRHARFCRWFADIGWIARTGG